MGAFAACPGTKKGKDRCISFKVHQAAVQVPTRIMQLVSLPKVQGEGHADVLWYFKCPIPRHRGTDSVKLRAPCGFECRMF